MVLDILGFMRFLLKKGRRVDMANNDKPSVSFCSIHIVNDTTGEIIERIPKSREEIHLRNIEETTQDKEIVKEEIILKQNPIEKPHSRTIINTNSKGQAR